MEDVLFDLEGAQAGYAGRAVLHGVDLRIRRGESIALMGRSGAGKSTLLGLLYDQNAQDIALIPQAAALVKPLSVFHNVFMGRLDRHSTAYNLRNLLWPAAAELEQISGVLADVDLAEKIREPASTLSGGPRLTNSIVHSAWEM